MEAYALVTAFAADGTRVKIGNASTQLLPAGVEAHFAGVGIQTILVTSVALTCEPDRRAEATTTIFERSPVTFHDGAAAPGMRAGCITVKATGFHKRPRIELVQPTDTLAQPRFNCIGTDDVDVSNGWKLLGDANAFGDGDADYLSVVTNNYVVRALWIAKIVADASTWETLSDNDRRCIAAWTLQGAGVLYCDGGKQIMDTRGLPDETFGIRKDCDGVSAAGACLFAALRHHHRRMTYAPTPLGAFVRSVVDYLVTSFAVAGVAFVMAVAPGSQARNHTSKAIHACDMHHKCVRPFGHAVLVLLGREPLVAEMTSPVAPVGTTKNDLQKVFVMGDAEYNDAAAAFRTRLHDRGYTHGSYYRGREWQSYFYKSMNALYTPGAMWSGSVPMDDAAKFYSDLGAISAPATDHADTLNHAYRRVPSGTVPRRMAPRSLHMLQQIPMAPNVTFAVQISKTDPRPGIDIDALNKIITTEPAY